MGFADRKVEKMFERGERERYASFLALLGQVISPWEENQTKVKQIWF